MPEPKKADTKRAHRKLKTAVEAVNAAAKAHPHGGMDDAFMALLDTMFEAVNTLKKVPDVYPDTVVVKAGTRKVYAKGDIHEYGKFTVTYDAYDDGKKTSFTIP